MAQIKYVVFACLIFLFGFISFTVIRKVYSIDFITIADTDSKLQGNAGESSNPQTKIGQTLFRKNCATCHNLDKDLVGPPLRGVTARGPWIEDKNNFKKWVRNPAIFIPTTQYTTDLQKKYNSIMPSFSTSLISDEELDEVYRYLDSPGVNH